MSKDNKKNRSYTREFKASVVKRLEQPTTDTIASLSNELGVPRTTIYQWFKKSEKDSNKTSINHKPIQKWTSEDKFHVVLETSIFSETELSEYCRKKGLYVDEVKTWKEQCLKANQTIMEDPKEFIDTVLTKRIPNPFMPDTPQRIATDTFPPTPPRSSPVLRM